MKKFYSKHFGNHLLALFFLAQMVGVPTVIAFENEASQEINYFSSETTCLKTADLQGITSHFTQFNEYLSLNVNGKICSDQMPVKAFQLARALLALERLVTPTLEQNSQDQLTLQHVDARSWWNYFKNRANRLVFDGRLCSANTVAYVQPFFRGVVNLCEIFYNQNVPSQVSTLLHEARHFDGHSHVTCQHGSDRGVAGACDVEITRGGSYAVSVQVGVTLAFADQVAAVDKAMAESEAIYLAVNRFNVIPEVKSSDFIYMSDSLGKVWKLENHLFEETDLQFVTQLENPSRVFSNGTNFTLFPVDLEVNANRIDKRFEVSFPQIGAFAVKYNQASSVERTNYVGVDYFGEVSSYVSGQMIFSSCGGEFKETEFSNEPIKSLVNLENSEKVRENFLLGVSGVLYKLSCDKDKKLLESTISNAITVAPDTQMAFSLNSFLYRLTDQGEVFKTDLRTGLEEAFHAGGDYLSITHLKEYKVFSRNLE